MSHFRILPALVIAAVTAGVAGAAVADTGKDNHEIATVRAARISAPEAIATAERQTGGRAIRIDVEKDNGAYRYEVKTVSSDQVTEVVVDPETGKVMDTDSEGLLGRLFDGDDRDDATGLAASPTTLAAAIAAAEQHIGGKTVEARFDGDRRKARFKIEVAKGNAVHKVIVDAASGAVVRVATGDGDEHGED